MRAVFNAVYIGDDCADPEYGRQQRAQFEAQTEEEDGAGGVQLVFRAEG